MSVDKTSEFGILLERHRRAAGLTQEELAERAQISARAISNLERGVRRLPYRHTVQQLSDALQLPLDERTRFEAASRHRELKAIQSDPITGSVLTFLFADIRGYTGFTAEHGDEMAAKLAQKLDRFARECVRLGGGEMVEMQGDEALAVFTSSRQALYVAIELQARVERDLDIDPTLPLKVGIGLDSGEAVRFENDYRGGALNRASRLCNLASRGTGFHSAVFASDTVIALAGEVEGLVYVDRGLVHLKGLASPIRVFQVGQSGEAAVELSPLPQAVESIPTNLPDEATPFVGRQREIGAVLGVCNRPTVRLVTLTGTGGVGKTRLALQVGAALTSAFSDGVFLVRLAAVDDPDHVASVIATTLQVQEVPGQNLAETLKVWLLGKRLLLILDNCEQLLGAASLIDELLTVCRGLHVLVTSRRPLHLAREQEYAVPPLSAPDAETLPDLQNLRQFDAVALFERRAQAVRAEFVLTDKNVGAVVEICRRLDGLPLAIELAAARVRLFSPQTLLPRLASRLELLTGGPRDAPARHRTLRGAIDWSYGLLAERERGLFVRLSVFAGDFTHDAVHAVCCADGSQQIETLDALESLVDHSLLQRRERSTGESSLAMLETIREYAVQQAVAGGEMEATRQRHLEYYLVLAEQAEPELYGERQQEWLGCLEAAQDDVQTALQCAIDQDDFTRALRLTAAMSAYWSKRGDWTRAREWLSLVLERTRGQPSDVRAKLLRFAGNLAGWQGEYAQALDLLEESLAESERRGNKTEVVASLNALACLVGNKEEYAEAEKLLDRSLTLARELGDHRRVAECLDDLGGVAICQEDYARATSLMTESLTIFRGLKDSANIAEVLRDLSWVAINEGDGVRARNLLAESLTLAHELRETWLIIYGLEGLSRVAAMSVDMERAARLWGAAATLCEEVNMPLPAAERALHDQYVSMAHADLEEHTFDAAWNEGRMMSMSQAVRYALTEGDDHLILRNN